HDRTIRKLVGAGGAAARVVLGKKRVDLGEPGLDAFDETARAKRLFHLAANRAPRALPDALVNPAIGDDLDIAIGEKQVDENATVLLGIPDPQQAESLERAL